MSSTIRPATSDDVAAISELAAASFGGAITDISRIERYYQNLLDCGGLIAIAETSENPPILVGLITCSIDDANSGFPKSIQPTLAALGRFSAIGELAVAPEYRKQGIGTKLLESIQTMAANSPGQPLTFTATCWINGTNYQSLNLFRRDGFKKIQEFNDDPQCCSGYPNCDCTHWLVVKAPKEDG